MPQGGERGLRFAIVAPTFNNAATLRGVLAGLDRLGFSIIVVDDGSSDETGRILRGWAALEDARGPGRIVRTHAANRGKAAALMTGFQAASHAGYSHAVTFDTDGQMEAGDVSGLVAVSREEPGALVLGWRDDSASDYPARSRVGRRISNAMVRALGGVAVRDSQCGLRVYPVERTLTLGCCSGRYEFETECIVRWAWSGMAVREVPVSCRYEVAGGRVTHFRVVMDTARAVGLHARLLGERVFKRC